jgi:excisionase family DNA binding protein
MQRRPPGARRTVAADRPLLGAQVYGYAAAVIAAVLDEVLPGRLAVLQRAVDAGMLHPDYLAELRLAWVATRQVGAVWLAWRAAAVDGSGCSPVTATDTSSYEVDTDGAAALLGVTANRVRQLVRCGRIRGRRVGRVWLVDRWSVLMYREEAGKCRTTG